MRDTAQRQEQDHEGAGAESHVEASPELQRLARSVVSDQAAQQSEAQSGTAGAQIDLPHRADMERRFGRSFADVRVSVDPVATATVGARAYTLGTQIVFATASPDRELVAHELAHVVQQREGRAQSVATDEAQAESVAHGGEMAAPAQKQGEGEAAPQQELRKDGILTPDQIKSAIAFNNSHWKDPHRSEILKTISTESAATEFGEAEVVRVASMQQSEGVDPKGVDGKLGAGTMAILLRKGLHLTELQANAKDVKLVFYPGEFEDLGKWKEAKQKAEEAAKVSGESPWTELYNFVPQGHGVIYVNVGGNVVDRIHARGGPPFVMKDGTHTADPSKAGTYKLGAGKSHVTKAWAYSQIAWGAPLREHDGDIEYKNPGENWKKAVKGDEEVLGIPKDKFYEKGTLRASWDQNDFGETAYRVEGSPGLFIHTDPGTEKQLKQEKQAQGVSDESQLVHSPMELSHSHGCLHVDPYDRNRLMKSGYLQKGVTLVIKKYEETLDVGSPNKK
jgi:hypothetical protein